MERTHSKLSAGVLVAIVLAFAGSLVGLHLHGQSSRGCGDAVALSTATPSVRMVRSSPDLFDLWMEADLHGRQLVHLSRYLHFVPVSSNDAFEGLDRFPIRTFDLPAYYSSRVNGASFLWVAMQTGVLRSVYHVLPAVDLDARLSQLRPVPPGIRVRGRIIRTTENGSPRTLSDRLPVTDEPVLVSIDASFLEASTPETVNEMLRASRLHTDLIGLCRAEDNPEVSPAARQRLEQLAKTLLRGGSA